MLKWLKNKIEINNRRNLNDCGDPCGLETWSIETFIIIYLFGLGLIIGGVILAICVHIFAGIVLAMFGLVFHIWQFWHLLFYYGPEYDNDYRREERTEKDKCEE